MDQIGTVDKRMLRQAGRTVQAASLSRRSSGSSARCLLNLAGNGVVGHGHLGRGHTSSMAPNTQRTAYLVLSTQYSSPEPGGVVCPQLPRLARGR